MGCIHPNLGWHLKVVHSDSLQVCCFDFALVWFEGCFPFRFCLAFPHPFLWHILNRSQSFVVFPTYYLLPMILSLFDPHFLVSFEPTLCCQASFDSNLHWTVCCSWRTLCCFFFLMLLGLWLGASPVLGQPEFPHLEWSTRAAQKNLESLPVTALLL